MAADLQASHAECLKDLQRFLRQDNEVERPAFFALCNSNVAKSDLVPLLAAYPDDFEIVFNAGLSLSHSLLMLYLTFCASALQGKAPRDLNRSLSETCLE